MAQLRGLGMRPVLLTGDNARVAGTVADDVLARYLVQDYRFCDAFTMLLGQACASAPDLAARLADPQTPVWVLTDAHGLVRSVVPRETILAAVDATRRP